MAPIIIATTITIAVLGFGAYVTDVGPWYRDLRKPSWNPPNWLFGPAWTLILTLAAGSGVLGWRHGPDPASHVRLVLLFGGNILLHLAWSPLFFNLRRPDLALAEVPFLWASILALMIDLAPVSGLASALLTPYLLWVTFAAILNLAIVRLNAPFGVAATKPAL